MNSEVLFKPLFLGSKNNGRVGQFVYYHYGYTALSWQMSAVLYAVVMLISVNQFVRV